MKVSLIIPYNKDRGWLDLAIQSVYDQTYKDVELIISQSDNGVSYNLNEGIKKAKGDFIKYLCEDDMLTSNSIQDSVNTMLLGNYDFIHGNSTIIHAKGNITLQRPRTTKPNLAEMIRSNVIHGGTLMYKADVFKRFGLFDETLNTGEEYDYNMKLLYNGAKLGYCDADLYKYRMHGNQKSYMLRRRNQAKRKATIEMIKNRYK